MKHSTIALGTGANKALGLKTSRQLALVGITVLMDSCDESKGRAAAKRLPDAGLPVESRPYPADRRGDLEDKEMTS